MANTGPYSLLSISATTLLTKVHPWRPERSTAFGPPLSADTSFLTDIAPQCSHNAEISSPAPTGHPLDPELHLRPISSLRCEQRYRRSPTRRSRQQTLPWSPPKVDKERPLRTTLSPVRLQLRCQPRQLKTSQNGATSMALFSLEVPYKSA